MDEKNIPDNENEFLKRVKIRKSLIFLENIEKFAHSKGLFTAEDIARRAGIDPNSLSRIKTGQRGMGDELLAKLLMALDMTVDEAFSSPERVKREARQMVIDGLLSQADSVELDDIKNQVDTLIDNREKPE